MPEGARDDLARPIFSMNMDILHITGDQVSTLPRNAKELPSTGWVWLDFLHEEIVHEPELFRDEVERLTGVRLFDLHLLDATNLQHPSYHDRTQDYDMIVFRKLALGEPAAAGEIIANNTIEERIEARANRRRMFQQIVTRPVTFFVFDRALVTVHSAIGRTTEQVRQRMLDFKSRGAGQGSLPDKQRLPQNPSDLMLRLLNNMVDRYLDLRVPLTAQLDRWQRELLDPRKPFDNWGALLDARNEIRKLENLCEEQIDALQELRDSTLDALPHPHGNDANLVRINDVMEHITRVLNHSRRMEASIETAVQLHFSAMSHRTNRIVQTLTVITAVFAPLTLITGIFGMNFAHMPLLADEWGFWAVSATMVAIAIVLLAYFGARRVIALRGARLRKH
jgi:Mg2+ and Co2+ transporter CorA